MTYYHRSLAGPAGKAHHERVPQSTLRLARCAEWVLVHATRDPETNSQRFQMWCWGPELQHIPGLQDRFAVEKLEVTVVDILTKTAETTCLMVWDLRAGRETEVKFIKGYWVQRGKEVGVPQFPLGLSFTLFYFTVNAYSPLFLGLSVLCHSSDTNVTAKSDSVFWDNWIHLSEGLQGRDEKHITTNV